MEDHKERIPARCAGCKKVVSISWYTRQCPKCGHSFPKDQVEAYFTQFHDINENSTLNKVAKVLDIGGTAMQGCGSCMQSIGCLLTLFVTIPIIIGFLMMLF